MKPSIKKISVCLLFSTIFALNTNFSISKASSFNEGSKVTGTIRRVYIDAAPVTYLHGEPIPETRYFQLNGGQGYLTKFREINTPEGVVVWYRGYLYSGDKIPIPTKIKEGITTLDVIHSKKVRVLRHFKSWKDITHSIYYDDGTYRGSLYQEDWYQNSDLSWDIYYEGIVKNVPYTMTRTEFVEK